MDTKKWYQSKSVIGGLVAVLFAAGSAFGILNSEDVSQTELTEAIMGAIASIGGIVAIFGRITAKTEIK